MTYTIDNILRDLKENRNWNEIRADASAAGLDLKKMEPEQRKEVRDAMNQYFRNHCPQEYKDNPQIHYEVKKNKK